MWTSFPHANEKRLPKCGSADPSFVASAGLGSPSRLPGWWRRLLGACRIVCRSAPVPESNVQNSWQNLPGGDLQSLVVSRSFHRIHSTEYQPQLKVQFEGQLGGSALLVDRANVSRNGVKKWREQARVCSSLVPSAHARATQLAKWPLRCRERPEPNKTTKRKEKRKTEPTWGWGVETLA